jgi:hypothetical protein
MSRDNDSTAFRTWIPVVVPVAAVVLTSLIFLIATEVLNRP